MDDIRLYSSGWKDYELIDAGGGQKFERWGSIYTIRPEVQAYFKSELPFAEWERIAHWKFNESKGQNGKWKQLKEKAVNEWELKYKRLTFQLSLTKFKHVGLFPEQRVNWDFLADHLEADSKLLNLFAYTGAASCVARDKGAETYHVDSVKQLIGWAKKNMELSRLLNVKWVHEDALKFAQREVKRGKAYNAIVMDPPAFGIGAKNERWKLEDKIDALMGAAKELLSEKGILILNTYSPTFDIATLTELSAIYFEDRMIEVKELWMKTQTGKDLYFGNVLRVS